ncbi:MAG: hypothetical protein ACREIQ_01845 [Nitrospiria bacterium]
MSDKIREAAQELHRKLVDGQMIYPIFHDRQRGDPVCTMIEDLLRTREGASKAEGSNEERTLHWMKTDRQIKSARREGAREPRQALRRLLIGVKAAFGNGEGSRWITNSMIEGAERALAEEEK